MGAHRPRTTTIGPAAVEGADPDLRHPPGVGDDAIARGADLGVDPGADPPVPGAGLGRPIAEGEAAAPEVGRGVPPAVGLPPIEEDDSIGTGIAITAATIDRAFETGVRRPARTFAGVATETGDHPDGDRPTTIAMAIGTTIGIATGLDSAAGVVPRATNAMVVVAANGMRVPQESPCWSATWPPTLPRRTSR